MDTGPNLNGKKKKILAEEKEIILSKEKTIYKRGYSKRTIGQKLADTTSSLLGSWNFISFLIVFIIVWITLNVTGVISSWDDYPFILLNLALSVMATFTAPIILMSQNREADRDRKRAIIDLATDRSSERKIKDVQQTLVRLEEKLDKIMNKK